MDNRLVAARPAGDLDIQQPGGLGAGDLNRRVLYKGRDAGMSRFRHRGNDLKFLVGLAGYDSGRGCGLHALHPAGVGHHDAFGVFQDIAGYLHQNLFRQSPQYLAHLRGAVGNGDGLGASGGGHQLLFQNRDKGGLHIRC